MENIMSSLGVPYGDTLPVYGGTVTNIATLPDNIFFHVENGCWDGYVTSEGENRIVYTGVDKKNPTEAYVNKITLAPGQKYDAAITIID